MVAGKAKVRKPAPVLALTYQAFPQTDKISEEQMANYTMSVIEREVQQGILKVKDTKATALAFLRKINNLNVKDIRQGNEWGFTSNRIGI